MCPYATTRMCAAMQAAWGLNRHSVVEVITDRTTNVELHRVVQVGAASRGTERIIYAAAGTSGRVRPSTARPVTSARMCEHCLLGRPPTAAGLWYFSSASIAPPCLIGTHGCCSIHKPIPFSNAVRSLSRLLPCAPRSTPTASSTSRPRPLPQHPQQLHMHKRRLPPRHPPHRSRQLLPLQQPAPPPPHSHPHSKSRTCLGGGTACRSRSR